MQFSIRILIRTFVRVNKLIWIYSDIHSCNFVDTNIFVHSFVSKFSRMSHSGSNLSTFCLFVFLPFHLPQILFSWKIIPCQEKYICCNTTFAHPWANFHQRQNRIKCRPTIAAKTKEAPFKSNHQTSPQPVLRQFLVLRIPWLQRISSNDFFESARHAWISSKKEEDIGKV